MNRLRSGVCAIVGAGALVAALTALALTDRAPTALASPAPDASPASAALLPGSGIKQRDNGTSACTMVMTDTLSAGACSATQVTVTLAVSCPVRLPLNVVLVVGRHLAMEDHLNDVKAAARDVVDRLNFDDGTKVGVVSLSTQERVEQDLTDRKTTALAAINRIQLDSISPFNNYYDWIGRAERMLTEARSDGDPAVPVIVLYSTGCPAGVGFDQYCQRQVGSANRAQGAGITMMTVCNPNARPFGFPLPGDHCRWIQQMASTGFYHDLSQAARISDDIEGVWDEGRSTTIDELVLTELLTEPLALIVASAAPPPEPVPGGALFRWQDLAPGSVVTATYVVSAAGGTDVVLRRDGSGAVLTDSRSAVSEPLSLPPRSLVVPECLAPTATATPTTPPATVAPTQTPPPRATATSRPGTAYLPVLMRNHCQPTRGFADVVLALDTSSSMAEPSGDTTKIEAAKGAARAFVAATRPGADQVAIVGFHETAEIVAPLGSPHGALVGAIDRLTTHPGTRIDRALEMSALVLAGPERRPRNRPVVILLSDGHTDGDRQGVVEAARSLHREAVTVYTVGLGPDVDRQLMEEVASSPQLYRPALDAGALAGIYSEIVRELPCAEAPAGRSPPIVARARRTDGAASARLGGRDVDAGYAPPQQATPLTEPAAYDGAAGGGVGALGLLGDELYAGIGARLARYSPGEPPVLTQTAFTGVLDAMIRDIAVRPNQVLLATEGGLYSAVDHGAVLDPGTRITTFGQAIAIEEAFGFAYVALGPFASGGVAVFDVTGPSPLPSGSVMDSWVVSDLAVSGRLLFASTGTGLVVASLARPDRPVEIGAFEGMPGAGPLAADPETGRLYVAGTDGVWVVDPTIPGVRGFVEVHAPTRIAVHGDVLLAANAVAQAIEVDVSDPDAPAVVKRIVLPEPATALAVRAGAAYAGSDKGVRELDLASGTFLVAADLFAPSDVAVGRPTSRGRTPLYAAANTGLVVLEAGRSVGAAPRQVASEAGAAALRVASDGEWVALLTADELQVFDARNDPFAPQRDAVAAVAGVDVAAADGVLVVALTGGLDVFYPESHGGLMKVGEVRGDWDVARIEVSGDASHVFALDMSYGVRVFSLAAATPRLVGGLELPMDEWATAFALDDHLLYVAAGGASDVRSTRPPVRTSTDGSTSARGSGPPAPPPLARLVTLDVTDPEKPVSAAPGEPWGWPSAAAADEDWVVAASTLGAGMPYPRRLALLGPTDHHLPLPWHVTGAAMAYPQVFLAAGAAGLIGAHVEHPAGPLATPTPWASTTPEPTSTTSPTTAARGFRIMLPATEAGS